MFCLFRREGTVATMAFVRCLTSLVKDKNMLRKVVPIVPDEAATFYGRLVPTDRHIRP